MITYNEEYNLLTVCSAYKVVQVFPKFEAINANGIGFVAKCN